LKVHLTFYFNAKILMVFFSVLEDDSNSEVSIPNRNMYINVRMDTDDRVTPGEPNEYEEVLDKYFWNLDVSRIQLIFIEGKVGIGKSTLICYYLDKYCQKKKSEVKSKPKDDVMPEPLFYKKVHSMILENQKVL